MHVHPDKFIFKTNKLHENTQISSYLLFKGAVLQTFTAGAYCVLISQLKLLIILA